MMHSKFSPNFGHRCKKASSSYSYVANFVFNTDKILLVNRGNNMQRLPEWLVADLCNMACLPCFPPESQFDI